MKPDFHNHPLTGEEFEKMPCLITAREYWEPVYHGEKNMVIDSSESWANPMKSVFKDSLKLIGFIGAKTGIRLSPECADLLEGKENDQEKGA